VTHSLKILHDNNLVHADLKPANILIKKIDGDKYVAKLIDFDNSYFSGAPPAVDEVVGDLVYYSPEEARYIREDPAVLPEQLTFASDIFALGLVFVQYLTGSPITLPSEYRYAHAAAIAGHPLSTKRTRDIPVVLCELVDQMLSKDATDRPAVGEVFRALKEIRVDEVTHPVSDGSRGRIVMGPKSSHPSSPIPVPDGPSISKSDEVSSESPKGGRLRGDLARKRTTTGK
jgi:serine/threonine protein kinase